MKRLVAVVLVCVMMLGSVCLAAEWPEGRSPAQPFSGKPEVNLEETLGYIILSPRAVLPARNFCDSLEIYLPREDVKQGQGTVRLYEAIEGQKEPVELCAVEASDHKNVTILPLSEEILTRLMWGGGVCVKIHLPCSLSFADGAHKYFVLMDENFITAANGKVGNPNVTNPEAWMPVVEGDYGVSGLYYCDAPSIAETGEEVEEVPEEGNVVVYGGDAAEGEEAEESEEAEPTPEPPVPEEGEEEEAAGVTFKAEPEVGDAIHFDLVVGGDVASAVIFSDNDSVYFDNLEYVESANVTGTVLRDDLNWGVVFLNANGDVLNAINFGK